MLQVDTLEHLRGDGILSTVNTCTALEDFQIRDMMFADEPESKMAISASQWGTPYSYAA